MARERAPPSNPLRLMIFKHTRGAWMCHEDRYGEKCVSRVTLLEYEWKGQHENWTQFSFCLDCDAIGIADPLDTSEDSKIYKTYKEKGYYPQAIYAKFFSKEELPPRPEGDINIFTELLNKRRIEKEK
jgi:hypothetical protein